MNDLRDPDFQYLQTLVHRESAIVLADGKEYLAQNRLEPVARRRGFSDLSGLVRGLRSGDRQLIGDVVDALTTNETSFFRDQRPWDALREQVLPCLFEARQSSRRLDVWFGAASSGQEPFSLAMLLDEHFATEMATWDLRLTATDISARMLERCRAGRYSDVEVGRGLTPTMRDRHLRRDGAEHVLRPDLVAAVQLSEVNLAATATWPWKTPFDIVFLRNVLIYFDDDTRHRILRAVREVIHDDGFLVLGAAETALNLSTDFVAVRIGESTMYRPR